MSTIAMWMSKAWLAIVVAAAGIFSGAPMHADPPIVSDASLSSTPTPSYDRLQHAWEREMRIYTGLGRLFDHADERLARAQELIDKARSNGKDIAALQAALDAFSAAVKQARPVYESGKGIVAAHKGFDADGHVVNAGQALQTVLDMRAKLKELRDIVAEPAKALREAIRAFREANPPALTPTPTAASG